MIAGPAPEAAVLPVEKYGIDRSGRAALEAQGITHRSEGLADPVGRFLVEENIAGLRGVVVKRTAHLEAVKIWGFAGFLNIHAEFSNIQEKLK